MHTINAFAAVNLVMSLLLVGLLIRHMERHISATTVTFQRRLAVWILTTYFFFNAVGSAMSLYGPPPPLFMTDSVLLKFLCDYRPTRSHIVMSSVGLLIVAWLHRVAHETNARKKQWK